MYVSVRAESRCGVGTPRGAEGTEAGGRRVTRRWRSPARAAGAASLRCSVGAPGPFRAAGWRWRRRPALATGSTPLPPCPPPGADGVDPRPVAGGATAAWPARPQDPRRCRRWGEQPRLQSEVYWGGGGRTSRTPTALLNRLSDERAPGTSREILI